MNPTKSVDADWTQSWNPAVGKPKDFIDINCLTRVENVMQYFCFRGSDTPEQLNMEWLVRFVLERYPYDLVWGAIFSHQSHCFEYKLKSFSDDFAPLQTLPGAFQEQFVHTLFISWGILTHLFEGKPISSLFSNVRNTTLGVGKERGETSYICRIRRRREESHASTDNSVRSNSSFSDDNGGDGNDRDRDNDHHGRGPTGPRQQQRGANGGSDRRPSKRTRGENDEAEGSSCDGDSDEEANAEDSDDLDPLTASAVDVDVTDISVLSEFVAGPSPSKTSLKLSKSTEDLKSREEEQPSSPSDEDLTEQDKTKDYLQSSIQGVTEPPTQAIDDRKSAAVAPRSPQAISAALMSDTASVAGTELYVAAAIETRTLVDEAETVDLNDLATQLDGDSDAGDGVDDEDDDIVGKKGAPLKKAGRSTATKYNAKDKTVHVASVGLGVLKVQSLTDAVAGMENPLMWNCPYVQLKEVLKKVLTRLAKDNEKDCDSAVLQSMLDMVETNRFSLDLSSKAVNLLGRLKPVTGAMLRDAVELSDLALEVHGPPVDVDAVYVPRGRNPLYAPLVSAVFVEGDPDRRIKQLENMMSGSKMDHITVRKM